MAAPAIGDGLLHGLWTTLTRRIAFAFGLVIAIAMLGALAFTARTDVRVLWFDERGHPTIGVLRTETQERLDQALRNLAQSNHFLDAERAQQLLQEQQFATELRRHQEAERAAHERLRKAEQNVQRAREKNAGHEKSINLFKQENAELRKILEERGAMPPESKTLEVAMPDKHRQIEQLKAQLHVGPQLNEYRAARIGDQLYLPLRDRPERASRTLKAIPSNSAGILSTCKVAVYEDAVFVEASFQGVSGWVSGYYLANAR